MTPKNVSILIDHIIASNKKGEHVTLFLHGPVGSAKSATIADAAKRHNIPLLDLRLSRLDVTDLTGALQVRDGKTYFAPPGWLPVDGQGILFFDEYPQAMVALQNIGGQAIYDRKVGDYELPPGWIVIVAGNRMSDRAGTTTTPQQINNRCLHINMDINYTDWSEYAADAGYDWRILAFLDTRQELLSKPSKDAEAFPSPRSWSFVNTILNMGLPPIIREETICGTIGDGVGSEFSGFLEVAENIVDWRSIFKNPKSADLPEGPAPTYALMNVLARNVKLSTIDNLVTYLRRINPEMGNICMHFVGRFHPVLKETSAYTKWMIDSQMEVA
jgi:hypothetical protein